MHKLNRGHGPACLEKFKHGRDAWDDVTLEDKLDIWNHLEIMQGNRCAYCEAGISQHKRHIDHFWQKAGHIYPEGTFEWDNLFGSCTRHDSCGRHKDHCGPYDFQDLIKPDVEDPEKFLLFITDGTIQARAGLSKKDAHRAAETLRILNLDAKNGPLRHMRKRAVAGYKKISEEMQGLAKIFPKEEWEAYLRQEIAATADQPFATAIKHALSTVPINGIMKGS